MRSNLFGEMLTDQVLVGQTLAHELGHHTKSTLLCTVVSKMAIAVVLSKSRRIKKKGYLQS
jgi:hypothetical protein